MAKGNTNIAIVAGLASVLVASCQLWNRSHKPLVGGIRDTREHYEAGDGSQAEWRNDRQDAAEEPWDGDDSWGNEAVGEESAAAQGMEVPAVDAADAGQLLVRTGYVALYNPDARCADWVAWHLTADHTTGPYKRKGVSFREDTDVGTPRAQLSDYYGSGYDRGHLCPSGDNKWSREAQEDCFLLTNICPQSHDLNGGDWNELEMKCRKWAERYGDVYIVCGPVYKGDEVTVIGKNEVYVPDGFFKVVLCTRGQAKAIGFYYDNDDGHRPMGDYVRTVDEIEALTGYDFFYRLDDATEERIEAVANLNDW